MMIRKERVNILFFYCKSNTEMSQEVFMKHRAISGFENNINKTTEKFYLISCSIVYIFQTF